MKHLTTVSTMLLLICNTLFSQIQIGNNIIPSINADGTGNNVSMSANANRVVFGSRLATINGNDFAGTARVYQNNNGTWEQLGQIIEGENELQFLGESVAISPDGNRIAIGSRDYLRIYSFNGSTWQQLGQDLTITNVSRTLEVEFSANGEILGVSFQTPGSNEVVHVFSINGNTWEEMGSTPLPGGFNFSLADSGNRIAITIENATDETRVFDFINNDWVQIGQTIPAVTDYYQENIVLSSDGNRLLIYASEDNTTTLQGFLSTYDLVNGTWTLSVAQLDLIDENPYSISLATSTNGERVAIGTSDDNFMDDYNSVQVFEVINNAWQQAGNEIQIWSHDEQTPSVVSMTPDGSKVAMSSLLSAPGVEEGMIRVFDYGSVLNVKDATNTNEVSLYPNPTKNLITIALKEPEALINLTITNILGQIISSEIWHNSSLLITNIEGASGVYFATIKTTNGTSITRKIIKE